MIDIDPMIVEAVTKAVRRFAERGHKPPFIVFADIDWDGTTLGTEYGRVDFKREPSTSKTPIGDTGMFQDFIYVLPAADYRRMKRRK